MGLRPGSPARKTFALLFWHALFTRKTKSRHPHGSAGALFRSDGLAVVKAPRAGRSQSDIGCQRQRLSFIRRGDAPAHFEKNATTSKTCRAGRSEQAKLTACRKVTGMYRRDSAKSRLEAPKSRGFCALCAVSLARLPAPARAGLSDSHRGGGAGRCGPHLAGDRARATAMRHW